MMKDKERKMMKDKDGNEKQKRDKLLKLKEKGKEMMGTENFGEGS